MERAEILAAMADLKLFGMRAAYDELMATAVRRQHEPQKVVSDLLAARPLPDGLTRMPTRFVRRTDAIETASLRASHECACCDQPKGGGLHQVVRHVSPQFRQNCDFAY